MPYNGSAGMEYNMGYGVQYDPGYAPSPLPLPPSPSPMPALSPPVRVVRVAQVADDGGRA